MNDWYKKPDTSSLRKLEALGEKVVWTKDIGDWYAIQTKSNVAMRKKSFGFENHDDPMYWKINKATGEVKWTEYVPLMFEKGFDSEPNYDLSILDQFRK